MRAVCQGEPQSQSAGANQGGVEVCAERVEMFEQCFGEVRALLTGGECELSARGMQFQWSLRGVRGVKCEQFGEAFEACGAGEQFHLSHAQQDFGGGTR